MRRSLRVFVLAVALVFAGTTAPSYGVGTGNEGCTPGYWKNHTDNWEEVSPSDTVGSIFSGASSATSSATLLEALQFRGGPGVDGAERILLRAAVAAYLNAVHDGLGYPLRRGQIVRRVNNALASGDRDTILEAARKLDRLNNLGCPLN